MLGFVGAAVDQLLCEDEELSRIAQANDLIHDGIVAMQTLEEAVKRDEATKGRPFVSPSKALAPTDDP